MLGAYKRDEGHETELEFHKIVNSKIVTNAKIITYKRYEGHEIEFYFLDNSKIVTNVKLL